MTYFFLKNERQNIKKNFFTIIGVLLEELFCFILY